MSRPHVKIFSYRKLDRLYVWIDKEYAGMVIYNGFMPLHWQKKYTAIIGDKKLPVESKQQGIEALVFEFCVLERTTPIE